MTRETSGYDIIFMDMEEDCWKYLEIGFVF
jgi:hypothetical protein